MKKINSVILFLSVTVISGSELCYGCNEALGLSYFQEKAELACSVFDEVRERG